MKLIQRSCSRTSAGAFVLLLASVLFGFPQNAAAATIEVTNTNDSGDGSLRAAITTANSNPNADLIQISVGGTIQLAGPLPSLQHQLKILSHSTTKVRRNTGGNYRIFLVASGANVTISGLTILNGLRKGTIAGDTGDGGGIFNAGTLTLHNCEISGNHASGANNSNSDSVHASGGGIFNSNNATLIIDHCTIAENSVTGGTGNVVSGAGGNGSGGGIYNDGILEIRSSTLSGNIAQGGTGQPFGEAGVGYGGAVFFNPAPVVPSIISSTISNNSAGLGGGLYAVNQACIIRSTIVAGNSAPTGPDCRGSITSQNYNLVGDTSDCTIGGQTAHNITNTNAKLGALEDNDGLGRTHELLAGSPAINAGDNSIVNAPLNIVTDQRFHARKRELAVDMGAFERGAVAVPPGDFNGDEFVDYGLFRSFDRKTALWYLSRTALIGSAYGPTLPAGWELVDVADFNSDAQSDYLLFNASTRQTAVWFMANATFIGSVYGPTIPDGWKLIGAPKFVGWSLRLLLFKPSTRQTAIWYLEGTAISRTLYGPTLPVGWAPVDAANFGDSIDTDLLLYHAETRKTAIWFGDGDSYEPGVYGPTAPSGWEVAGAADFLNEDDNADLVLFNSSTRKTAIWYLSASGPSVVDARYGPTLPAGWILTSP